MARWVRRVLQSWATWLPGLYGVVWYLALGGARTLDPSRARWMLEGDWFSYFFAWCFYRNADWALPLGGIPQLQYPFGTTVGLTDAIPLLSAAGKVISPLAPEEFQLFGWWMCAGLAAMGVVGSRLVARVSADRWLQVLGGALLVMNPIISTRYGHPPFFGLWALFGLIGLTLAPPEDATRAQRLAWALLFAACGTHPYLAVMCGPVVMALALRLVLEKRVRGTRVLLALGAPPLVAAFGLWLFGYLSSLGKVEGGAEGFGQFSADLLTLFNPSSWSRFFTPIAQGPRQYEGFAYLGLGGGLMALIALGFGLSSWRHPRRALTGLPLVLVALALAFYALSDVITLAGKPVLELHGFYAKLGPLPSMFRSSGRFVWPLHALLVLGGLVVVARWSARSPLLARGVLLIAVLAQLADVNPTASTFANPGTAAITLQSFKTDAWLTMGRDYRHLAIVPPQLQWFSPFDGPLVAQLSWEAYRQKMSMNSGHVGRPPAAFRWDAHLESPDPQTVYVVYFREYLQDFTRLGWTCGVSEGLVACVDPSRATTLKAALEEGVRRGEQGALRNLH